MSARIQGIYATALWDYQFEKSHFLYDKYSCVTKILPVDKMAPLHFKSPKTGIDYYFSPIVAMLENTTHTTDVQKVVPEEPLFIRDRPAWKWSAILDKYPVDVFYSVEKDGVQSVPLRMVLYDSQTGQEALEVHEIFKFRIGDPNPSV